MTSCPVVTHSHAPIPHFLLSIQESVHKEKLAHAFAEAQKYTAHAPSFIRLHSFTNKSKKGGEKKSVVELTEVKNICQG